MNAYSFSITNLTCSACEKVCAMILKKLDGVESVVILENGATKVVSSKPLDTGLIRNCLKEKGYVALIT